MARQRTRLYAVQRPVETLIEQNVVLLARHVLPRFTPASAPVASL
jgi:hypothetical protein